MSGHSVPSIRKHISDLGALYPSSYTLVTVNQSEIRDIKGNVMTKVNENVLRKKIEKKSKGGMKRGSKQNLQTQGWEL